MRNQLVIISYSLRQLLGAISLEYEGNTGDPWVNTARTKALVEEAFG